MRVLLIDKNLVDPINQTKWTRFAGRPGVQLMGIVPKVWRENYRALPFKPSDKQGFPILPLPVVWSGYENRGFYLHGLGRSMKSFMPDVVLAFEEPFSFFALQSVIETKRHASNASVVLFSWDNISSGSHFPYRPSILYQGIERWVMKQISLLLTANQEAADRFAGMYPKPVRKLYFGIDVERLSLAPGIPRKEPGHANGFRVGYVGRLIPMKGLSDLLESMTTLPPSVHLSIVGNGPDLPRLQGLVPRLALENRVTFHPAVSSSEVRDIFLGLDALVLPSRTTPKWKEQYGRVLIEAMACGTPVIGSSSGAIPEVIGDAGLVFPEGDPVALAACIRTLYLDRVLCERYSLQGIERAKQFSAETFALTLHRFLRELDIAK